MRIKNIILKLACIALYFVNFSIAEKDWMVISTEWMLLDENKHIPQLFDQCPKKNQNCTLCHKFSDKNVNIYFKQLYDNNLNEEKFYCFYYIRKPEDYNKMHRADRIKEKFDATKHITLPERLLCNSYCIPAIGKKCGRLKKGQAKESFKTDLYYCNIDKFS